MTLEPLTKILDKEETVVMPKLSTIFRRASMELEQIRGRWGFRSEKRACAVGAIRFYLGYNEQLNQPVVKPNTPEYVELKRQMILLESHLIKAYNNTIVGMNDSDSTHWSFTRFAEECEMLGI